MPGKITSLLIGLFFALAALEGALRVVGHAHEAAVPVQPPGGATDILCLGNSYTEGQGAPPGESYCDWLRKLAEARTGRQLKMVNLGKSTRNSSQILATLEQDLAKYSPRLVLVMAGEPNVWNHWGLSAYRARARGSSRVLARIGERLGQLKVARLFSFLSSRFDRSGQTGTFPAAHPRFPSLIRPGPAELGYAWATWLSKYDGRSRVASLTAGEAEEARSSLGAAEAAGRDRYVSLALARLHSFRYNDPAEGLRSYRVSLELAAGFPYEIYLDLEDPSFARGPAAGEARALRDALARRHPHTGALRLARALRLTPTPARELFRRYGAMGAPARKDFDAAMDELVAAGYPSSGASFFLSDLRLSQKRPTDAVKINVAYLTRFPFDEELNPLFRLRLWLDEPQVRESIRAAIGAFHDRFPRQADQWEKLGEGEVVGWVESDLGAMERLFRARGARFAFMTYPPNVTDLSSRYVDTVIRGFASRTGAPLFDTWDELLAPFSAEKERGRLYASNAAPFDNHLTSLGNRILAERLLEFLRREGLGP